MWIEKGLKILIFGGFVKKKWRPIWPPICNQPAASHTGCKKNPSEIARILEGANQNRTDA